MTTEQTPQPKKKRPANAPGGWNKGMRKLVLDEKALKKIRALSGCGLNMKQIATIMDVSRDTLERMSSENEVLRSTIEKGREEAIAAVSMSAYRQAVSGKNTAMTIFYLKCRAHWKEHQVIEHEGEVDLKHTVVTMTDEERDARIDELLADPEVAAKFVKREVLG